MLDLLHVDCYEALPHILSLAKIRPVALISDPPYGINYRSTHSSAPNNWFQRYTDFDPIVGDDEPFDPTCWLDLAFPWIVLWGANHYMSQMPSTKCILTWDKLAGKTPCDSSDTELAYTNLDKPCRTFTHLWRGLIRAGEANGSRSHKLHGNQKPVELMMWVLRMCNLPRGTLIVDPFAGSGPIGQAAIRYGFDYLGIEKDAKHFTTLQSVINKELKQPHLTDPYETYQNAIAADRKPAAKEPAEPKTAIQQTLF